MRRFLVPSERAEAPEPILGKGAGSFVAELLVIAISLGLFVLIAWAGGHVVSTFKEPQHQQVEPGDYSWTPERGLVRTR